MYAETFDGWWDELRLLAEREDWELAEQCDYLEDYESGLSPQQVLDEEISEFEESSLITEDGTVWDFDDEDDSVGF